MINSPQRRKVREEKIMGHGLTQINTEVKGKEKEKECSPLPASLLGGDKRRRGQEGKQIYELRFTTLVHFKL